MMQYKKVFRKAKTKLNSPTTLTSIHLFFSSPPLSRFSSFPQQLGDVDAVEVVGTEGTVALGALPLSGVVARLQTLVAEHVEALGEHCLLVAGVAARTTQLRLKGVDERKYRVNLDRKCTTIDNM